MLYGILGSGQLAWMLGLAAKKLGYDTRFVDSKLATTEEQLQALQGCDHVTFESEFLDYSKWKKSLATFPTYPTPATMELLSDKWEQKKLFEKFKLPTAVAKLIEKCPNEVGVAKWSRQGYDGYGNLVLRSQDDENLKKWPLFADKAKKQNSRIYFEELIPFDAECALVVARDKDGKFLKYPSVLTQQKESVCNWVWGPAANFIPGLEEKMNELWPDLEAFMNSLNYVGVLAFEFFWLKGKLYLNEVAPRVHNSGHITLDAFNYSQFDLHLMAPEGFGKIQIEALAKNYVMKNLLGETEKKITSKSEVSTLDPEKNVKKYWYGKNEIRKGRKMGHLNCLFKDEDKDKIKSCLLEKEENLWHQLK